jgi:hypothetical protein
MVDVFEHLGLIRHLEAPTELGDMEDIMKL